MDLGLQGKVVVVAGAGAGIGRITALTFAQEGANVAINDLPPASDQEKRWVASKALGEKLEDVLGKDTMERTGALTRAESVAAECRKMGVKAIHAYASVTDLEAVTEMIKKVVAEFGRIDILANCAGGADFSDFINSTKEQWDYTVQLCLYGVLNCCKAALPYMIEHKYGKIVNLLSDAWKGADRGLSVYGAAKAGISSFTRTLALEVGRFGINVNAVSPGATTVEWAEQMNRRQEEALGKEAFEKRRQAILKGYPLGRFYGDLGKPEDIANMVVFLCSERARWVTGQSISVSGGYHMH